MSAPPGEAYIAVGTKRALASAIGLPSRSTSASWMLVLLMPEVSHDPHLLIRYSESRLPEDAEVGPSADGVQRYQETLKRNNYGFAKVELLEGNIGYLDLREFASPDEAGDRLAAAMKVVADSDALVIDLRQNFGGSPEMVAALCSYFFERRFIHFLMITDKLVCTFIEIADEP
jgi:hypothetical protein